MLGVVFVAIKMIKVFISKSHDTQFSYAKFYCFD